MKEFIEKEKLRIEEFLKDSMEHQDKKIDYILYKSDTKETNILCSNSSSEEAIEFTPITKNYQDGYSNVPEWDFNFDYYIYNLLCPLPKVLVQGSHFQEHYTGETN